MGDQGNNSKHQESSLDSVRRERGREGGIKEREGRGEGGKGKEGMEEEERKEEKKGREGKRREGEAEGKREKRRGKKRKWGRGYIYKCLLL